MEAGQVLDVEVGEPRICAQNDLWKDKVFDISHIKANKFGNDNGKTLVAKLQTCKILFLTIF